MAHIAIIGAGITGVTSAHALLSRGHRVTVIDRHRYPAMETSFANGGQLSVSNAEVWNSRATIFKGLRWMLRSDAPLLLNLKPSFHKYSWLAEFCGQIRNYERNSIETVRLALDARKHLFDLADQEGIDFDLKKRGILHLYHDRPSFETACRTNRMLTSAGLHRFVVTPGEMLRIEPTLNGRFHGGLFTPDDATGDIHKFTRGLAKVCERRGAQFHLETRVGDIHLNEDAVNIALPADDENIRADAIVICAGIESRRFAAMLGDRINIYPVKGYSITVRLDDPMSQNAAPQVSLLDEDAKIVTSRLGRDRFRVAGTAEFNGENRDIRADRIAPLVNWSQRLFPGMSTEHVIPWAGLRPMTPSMLPRVGRGRRGRVFYNCGHGHLGWTLSAATAQIVAQAIDDELGRT